MIRPTPSTRVLAGAVITAALGCGRPASEVGVEPLPFAMEAIDDPESELFRASVSPDGAELFYFRKVTPDTEDYRIFRTRFVDGAWSAPEMLALGDSTASNLYPTISPDGRTLVFTSYRPVDRNASNANLWMASREGDSWSAPRLLEASSTLENYDAAPWFGPGGVLHFTSTSPDWSTTHDRQARPIGDAFGPWEPDPLWEEFRAVLPDHHVWSGVLAPDGDLAVLEVSARGADGRILPPDLWAARRSDDGWTAPTPLPSPVNSPGTENFPSFAHGNQGILLFVRDFATLYHVPMDSGR